MNVWQRFNPWELKFSDAAEPHPFTFSSSAPLSPYSQVWPPNPLITLSSCNPCVTLASFKNYARSVGVKIIGDVIWCWLKAVWDREGVMRGKNIIIIARWHSHLVHHDGIMQQVNSANDEKDERLQARAMRRSGGRAVAQAVSRRFTLHGSPVMWDLWWTNWHWGQVFCEYLCFPCQSFHRLLHTHHLGLGSRPNSGLLVQ
jgi:hypothetical protein